MSKVFGFQDVAALVAAFPPLKAEGNPKFVRSNARDALVSWDCVQRKLHDLISSNNSRIKLDDLPKILDVEEDATPDILSEIAGQACHSQDGRSLLPFPEVNGILDNLKRDADESVIDVSEWCRRSKIDSVDLVRLIGAEDAGQWRHFTADQTRYVCSSEHMQRTIETIARAIRDAGSDITDLSATLKDLSPAIINEIAGEAALPSDGELKSDGQRVLFVPADHYIAESNKLSEARASVIKDHILAIEQQTYCVIDGTPGADGLAQQVINEYEKTHAGGPELRVVAIKPGVPRKAVGSASLLITAESLVDHVRTVKEVIKSQAETVWSSSGRDVDGKGIIQRIDQLHANRIHELLMTSEYMVEFAETARAAVADLEQKNNDHFIQMVNDRLVAPMTLYASGIAGIKDATLKQNLQLFVLDHCQTHYTRSFGKEVQERGVLDKSKSREIEKFLGVCRNAKTFDELQTAINKLVRKLKMPIPSTQALHDVKKRTLKNILRFEIQQKATASIVLQNTIWLLLAQKSEGLFVSSGKDTSRMIKQYESVGEVEISRKLIEWRDLAKAGQATEETLSEMRSTAKSAFQTMYPPSS